MRKLKLIFLLLLAACGKDPKVEQAKGEVEQIAASIDTQMKGDSQGPCPGFKAKGKPFALDPSMPRNDPWGNPYAIDCNGSSYEVVSSGPDAKPGTKDDVRSAVRQ